MQEQSLTYCGKAMAGSASARGLQSLTCCGKAMAGSASAWGSALCKHNYLQPVGRQWQDQHQQESLHFSSTITYFLWEGNGKISINKGVCNLQAQSLTPCRKAMSGSAREYTPCKHNHLHTMGRQWQDQHLQGGMHFASTITYSLW